MNAKISVNKDLKKTTGLLYIFGGWFPESYPDLWYKMHKRCCKMGGILGGAKIERFQGCNVAGMGQGTFSIKYLAWIARYRL